MKLATNLNADAIYKKLDAASADWVEWNFIAENLDKECKEILARLTLDSTQKTVEGRKNEALIDPDYILKKAQEIEAKRDANRARRRILDAETWIELRRTEEATRRQELKTLGDRT